MLSTIWFLGLLALIFFRWATAFEGRYAPLAARSFLYLAGGLWMLLAVLLVFTDPWVAADYFSDTSDGGRNGWLANVIVFFQRLGPDWNAAIWGSFAVFFLWAAKSGFWWRWAHELRENLEEKGSR